VPASAADVYTCTDGSGAKSFWDTPCKSGQTLTKHATARPQACSPWTRRTYTGGAIQTTSYSLPQESAALACDIADSRRNIAALEADQTAAAGAGGTTDTSRHVAGSAKSNIDAERTHLVKLQLQQKYSALYPNRHLRMGELIERCNNESLANKDLAARARCDAELRDALGE
jgi:hypothetical protein